MLPNDFLEYIYHVGNSHDLHSIIRIDSGRKRCCNGAAYGILYGRGPHECASSRAARVRFDKAQSCNLQAKLESASKFSLLGQSEACSKKGTDILPNKVERNHSLRHSHHSVLKRWF